MTLTFDENVRLRMAYANYTGYLEVQEDNAIHHLQGTGVVEYETDRVHFYLSAGSSGSAWADGNPNTNPDQPPNIPSFDSFSNPSNGATVLWSFSELDETPVLPGQSVLTPIKCGTSLPTDDGEPPVTTDPDNSAAVNLTMPIVGDLGHTGKIFGGIPIQVLAGPSAGARVTGYTLTSEHEPLTSIVIPSLPAGGENLSISFNEQTLPVVAEQEIDFGPGGAREFTISGFDPTAPNFTAADLVMGLQFAEEGLASLTAIPTLYIPPGDFSEDGLVNAADNVTWRKGLATGRYTEDDYNTWRANFGAPAGGAAAGAHSPMQSAIPEPSALALAALAIALSLFLRK
jgi:hypothetical protein